MVWREPRAPLCSDTGKPVPWLGYSAFTRNAPKLTDNAAGGRQGGTKDLATFTDVALMGSMGSCWRCDWIALILVVNCQVPPVYKQAELDS
jgi:hypothetical protein